MEKPNRLSFFKRLFGTSSPFDTRSHWSSCALRKTVLLGRRTQTVNRLTFSPEMVGGQVSLSVRASVLTSDTVFLEGVLFFGVCCLPHHQMAAALGRFQPIVWVCHAGTGSFPACSPRDRLVEPFVEQICVEPKDAGAQVSALLDPVSP